MVHIPRESGHLSEHSSAQSIFPKAFATRISQWQGKWLALMNGCQVMAGGGSPTFPKVEGIHVGGKEDKETESVLISPKPALLAGA